MRVKQAVGILSVMAASIGAAPAEPSSVALAPAVSSVAENCVGLAARLDPAIADAKAVFSADSGNLPEHCKVTGAIEKRVGVDGKPYAIGFELRVPSAWNGGLVFQGGGGLNGILFPATGRSSTILGGKSPDALQRGFAVVSTDSGHIGGNSAFGRDQQATLNYSYAFIGKLARVSKQVVQQLTSRRPARTYYMGCSNGGREAMIAAQRFPDEFDGVVAANPAFNIIEAGLLANYSTQIYLRLSLPTQPSPLTQADLKLVGAAVVKQCDGLDGRQDGMIFAQDACRFDPTVLICKRGQTADCLTKAKAEGIRDAFRGPLDVKGKPLFSPWPYDASIGDQGWLAWQTGSLEKDGRLGQRQNPLVSDAMSGLFSYPPIPQSALATLNVEQARLNMAAMAAQLQATDTRMSSFASRGGKMLLITGWNDPIFSGHDLTRWYRKLDADETAVGRPGAMPFARLFMVPGMLHCGGGQALDNVDPLSVLVDWVEKGIAPDRIVATGQAFPGQSRPLCPYPAYARYDGRGDPADQKSYNCSTEGLPK